MLAELGCHSLCLWRRLLLKSIPLVISVLFLVLVSLPITDPNYVSAVMHPQHYFGGERGEIPKIFEIDEVRVFLLYYSEIFQNFPF